tara:strand:+ start:170 stop:757 length:588 start_codon:yes stop_codon:yes gene_type:complete
MNWKHYTFIFMLVFGLCSSIATCVREKNNTKFLVSQTKIETKKHQDIIDSNMLVIDSLQSKDALLIDSITSLNSNYAELLSITQELSIVDSLQKEEIRKGKLRYGNPIAKQYQPVLASAFGNNAFDELQVLDKRLENQLKVVSMYSGVTLHKDTIINIQKITIKKLADKAKPNFWQRIKDWLTGILIGGGILLLM